MNRIEQRLPGLQTDKTVARHEIEANILFLTDRNRKQSIASRPEDAEARQSNRTEGRRRGAGQLLTVVSAVKEHPLEHEEARRVVVHN